MPPGVLDAADRMDRASAAVCVAVGEMAMIGDPAERAEFVMASLRAIAELLPQTIAANDREAVASAALTQ
jgi:hypothetical protein